MINWPYYPNPTVAQPTIQPTTITWNTSYLSSYALEELRTLIREELAQALHPEEKGPSMTLECEVDGKKYRGTVYLVEGADEQEAS